MYASVLCLHTYASVLCHVLHVEDPATRIAMMPDRSDKALHNPSENLVLEVLLVIVSALHACAFKFAQHRHVAFVASLDEGIHTGLQ